MDFRNLLSFPHILKSISLIFLCALLIILWENRQYPSTKLTSWQVLPLLCAIGLTIWAEDSVHDPEWAYLEVIFCSLLSVMSGWNCVLIWGLKITDLNTYIAIGISTFLAVIWVLQLLAFLSAACFDFWDFAREERAIEETKKRTIRSLSAQLSGAFFVEEEVLEEVTYREYRPSIDQEQIENGRPKKGPWKKTRSEKSLSM